MEAIRSSWNRLLDALTPFYPYIYYATVPIGIYAVARLLYRFVPGPHCLSKFTLCDRVVLITGASSGLGKELAILFYRKGAKLILVARSTDALKKLCEELKATPGIQNTNEPVYSYFDMNEVNEKSVEAIVSLSPTGRIDVLVNNAGISMRGSCEETTMEVQRKVE